MLYNEEYNELLVSKINDNINIGNTGEKIGVGSIETNQLSTEVILAMENNFIAKYQNLAISLFTNDGSYHTLDLSDYIGTGVKTVLFNMVVDSNDDGDDFRFANPDDHNLECKIFVNISPDPVNYTSISGVMIATTDKNGQIDYLSDSDNTQVYGRILGYWNTIISD